MKGKIRVIPFAQAIVMLNYRLSSVLSMNAAVSASVVLSSRLSTNVSVFALMLFSIQLFALYPIFRHRLQVMISSSFASPSLITHLDIGHRFVADDHSRTLRFSRLANGQSFPHRDVVEFCCIDLYHSGCSSNLDMGPAI